jgi:hypothetical protein
MMLAGLKPDGVARAVSASVRPAGVQRTPRIAGASNAKRSHGSGQARRGMDALGHGGRIDAAARVRRARNQIH